MAIFSSGGTTYPDFYICLSLFILTLISVPLNSLVIRHNLLKQPSIPRNLFLLLAVCDLSASVYISIDFSVGALADKDIQGCMKSNLTRKFCEKHYFATFSDASILDRVRAVFRALFIIFPSYLTGLSAITRFLQIKYPLRRIINFRTIIGFLVLCSSYTCLIYVLFYRKGDEQNPFVFFIPSLQTSFNMNPSIFGKYFSALQMFLILNFFSVLLQFLAVCSSLLTVWELVKMYRKPMTRAARKNSLSGSLKVLITNFCSLADLSMVFIQASTSEVSLNGSTNFPKAQLGYYWEMFMTDFLDGPGFWEFVFLVVCFSIFPTFLSTLNPAIYILLTPKSRMWKSKCRSIKSTVNSAITDTRNL